MEHVFVWPLFSTKTARVIFMGYGYGMNRLEWFDTTKWLLVVISVYSLLSHPSNDDTSLTHLLPCDFHVERAFWIAGIRNTRGTVCRGNKTRGWTLWHLFVDTRRALLPRTGVDQSGDHRGWKSYGTVYSSMPQHNSGHFLMLYCGVRVMWCLSAQCPIQTLLGKRTV